MSWRGVFVIGTALGLLVAGVMVAPASGEPVSGRAVVRTDRGPVRGVVGDDHRLFLGIPYAAPPVGELRLRPPQPAPRWQEPLDATAPRNICAQLELFGIPGSDHEDCL